MRPTEEAFWALVLVVFATLITILGGFLVYAAILVKMAPFIASLLTFGGG